MKTLFSEEQTNLLTEILDYLDDDREALDFEEQFSELGVHEVIFTDNEAVKNHIYYKVRKLRYELGQ